MADKKYRLLLTGKNSVLIDVFFAHMQEDFECYTSSGRTDDIANHLKLFTPDAVIYCMNKETPENIAQIIACKDNLRKAGAPFLVAGADVECNDFNKESDNMSEMLLPRPFTASLLTEKLMQFFEERREETAEAAERERAAAEAAERERAAAEAAERERAAAEAAERERAAAEAAERERAAAEAAEQERIARAVLLAKQDQIAAAVAAAAAEQEMQAAKKHILVIDDDPLILKLVKEQLHEEYEVGTAVSGKVAMKFLEKKTVDLILLDFEMPEENGAQVLEQLHNNPSTKNIPVIFLTGITEKGKVRQALAQQPEDYLLKPIEKEKLMRVISRYIK